MKNKIVIRSHSSIPLKDRTLGTDGVEPTALHPSLPFPSPKERLGMDGNARELMLQIR